MVHFTSGRVNFMGTEYTYCQAELRNTRKSGDLNLLNFQSPHWLEYLKIELRLNLKMTQSTLTNEILKIKKI